MMANMVSYRRALPLLCAGVLILGKSSALAKMEIAMEGYTLPLVDRYAIHRMDGSASQQSDDGLYQLVELSTDPQGPAYYHCSWTIVLPNVEQVAVVGTVIAGKARNGYFLLDSGRANARPQIFDSLEKLESAIAAAGAGEPLQLTSPDAIAATKPSRVLRPWHYRVMGNALGRSDGEWSLIVQLAGLLIALVVGLLSRSSRSLMPAALLLGILVNVVAQMYLAGGGGGAFVGFIIYPLIYFFVAVIGHTAVGLVCFLRARKTVAACNAPENKSSHT